MKNKSLFCFLLLGIGFGGYYFYSVRNKVDNSYELNDAMFEAVYKFEEGKYEEALDGDDVNLGFEQASRQGSSDTARIADLYAATCWLKLYNILFDREKCQVGIDHLKYLKLPAARILSEKKNCLLGDLYVEHGSYNEGGLMFMKIAENGIFKKFRPHYYFKAALAFPNDGRQPQAIQALKKIVREYPDHPYYKKALQRLTAISAK